MHNDQQSETYLIKDILDGKGRVSREQLLKGFIESDFFRSDGTKLFVYKPSTHCWEYLKEAEVNHQLRKFIPEDLQTKLTNTLLKAISLDMLESPALLVDFVGQCKRNKLNILNGALDIETLTLSEPQKDDGYTYCLKFNYLEQAQLEDAKNFMKFLRTSLDFDTDPLKTKLLLQILGYSVGDVIGAKRLFFFLGAPGGGKSMLLHLIEHVVGVRHRSIVGLHELSERFRLFQLVNARVNLGHEVRHTKLRCLDLVKKIAANEPILVEQKGRDAIEIQATTKMIFCGNSMPQLSEYDNEGVLTRIVLLLFPHGNTEETWDINLLSKIKEEADIIFSLAVNELKKLVESQFVFAKPADSVSYLTSYGNNQNSVKLFVKECCELAPNHKEHYKTFYESYLKFCYHNALSGIDDSCFKNYILGIKGVVDDRFRIGGSESYWGVRGIGIKKR
jgi:P4 family phage/plasmid primase-like protien